MSSLTPCRFFAQGNCRYGNNCRYYHGQPAGGATNTTTGYFGNRTLAPATFQPQQQHLQQAAVNLSTKSNQNLDIIVETVKKDMHEWQNSAIWPYSSYGPIGGKPSVPGFEDVSTEEYRYNYMLNGGNLPPQIPLHFQQMQILRQSYQQPGQDNRNILERIATATTATSPTAGQQVASIFGGGNQQQTASSIFGGGGNTTTQQTTASAASIFGGGGSTTGGGGLFASQQQPQQQTTGSIFGGSSTFGAGQQTTTPSLFSQPAVSAANTGMFQTQQPQQQQSIFGAPPTIGQAPGTVPGAGLFHQPQQQSIFGQQAQVPPTTGTPSLFQQPAAAVNTTGGGLFQQPPQNQPGGGGGLFQMLQQPQQQNVFGGGGSIFGGAGQPQQQPQQQQQQQFGAPPVVATSAPSIFGGPSGNNPLMHGQQGGIGGGGIAQPPPPTQASILLVASQQKGVYTPETDLTPEELEAFKADQFTLETLPTKPPPQNLCL